MYRFERGEPIAVMHRAMIERLYFLWARQLTQLGSHIHELNAVQLGSAEQAATPPT
jgi:hypothetical protein